MKARIEDSLRALEPALHQRLTHVLQHLRGATWPELSGTGCSTDNGQHLWTSEGPRASEDELTRLEAIALMQRQLREQDERPGSVFETLAFIEDNAATLVAATIAMISVCVDGLVQKEYRAAVLSRQRLVQEWPWPSEFRHGGGFVHLLLAIAPTKPPTEPLFTQWPGHIASATVAEWAESWLHANAHPHDNEGDVVELMKEARRNTPIMFVIRDRLPFTRMGTPALALLYLLEREVEENQKRTFIAIDTCKEHTKLIEAWRDLPKSKRKKHRTGITNGRLELILPDTQEKRHFQLSLKLGDEPVASYVANVLREWRSWVGLRHWVAFQSQITSNKRLGWVRWTVEDHLKALGYRKDRRRRIGLRRSAAEMVQLFTQIEVAVYDDKGRIRERRPLVLTSNTYERLVGSQWEIEGLELKINPLLYRGVRDPDTGELGKNWWPTPHELAHIDHENYGPAIALGTILPARWRMELSRSKQPYVDLKGESLLRAAGLPYRPRNLVAT